MPYNCICTLCGAEAYSKCPACRTVFTENQMDSVLSWILKRYIKKEDNLYWLKIDYLIGNSDISLAEALERLYEIFKTMEDSKSNYPTLKQYACDHRWTMKKGEHSSIGCGHF